MKRKYEKPSMKVYELQHRQMILCGSCGNGYPGGLGYTPGIGGEENKLA